MSSQGIPPFHVHPGHAFAGFELAVGSGGSAVLLARCDCGAVLDVAEARFAPCPDCGGRGAGCSRCGGDGRVVDHAALEWRPPAEGQNVP
jgi:hypothetical protein